jgi:Cu-Zn family superoxide dismutase
MMMKHMKFFALFLAGAAMVVGGCETVQIAAIPSSTKATSGKQLVAVMQPTTGRTTRGVVTFTEVSGSRGGIKVVADISGLSPNGTHAIHVHQYGDVRSTNGKSAGGHYNPQGHDHALPVKSERHAGDLGNLTADYNGDAHYEITITNVTLSGRHNPIIGRGVIIHAKADDGGQPTGNAGSRIAMGVIGVAKP